MVGIPGISPSSSPPITSVIGYGTSNQLAAAFGPAGETNRAASSIWMSPMTRPFSLLRSRSDATSNSRADSDPGDHALGLSDVDAGDLAVALHRLQLLAGLGELQHVRGNAVGRVLVRDPCLVGKRCELRLDRAEALVDPLELLAEHGLVVCGHRKFLSRAEAVGADPRTRS